MSGGLRWRAGACALLWIAVCAVGQVPARVANTTLQFPSEPPVHGYGTEPAFPGRFTFSQPVAIASPPGETNRLFIVEKAGRIQVIPDLANPVRTLFLDITAQVNPTSEGGLLGLAFHPGYATNRLFFVVYSLDTDTALGTGFHVRLARFETADDDPNRALPESEVPLITQYHRRTNHNGGDVHFGPDGYLYVSLGDEGGGGDPFLNSRVIDRDFFCAILRIDVDQRPGSLPPNPHPAVSGPYTIPPDNPFIGATRFDGRDIDPGQVRTEFWAVGLRNPWRFTFDSATGRLYCADVGQSAREEINVIERGGNYGWNYREGTVRYTGSPPPDAVLIEPILDYPRSGPAHYIGISVTGGVVYRGTRISQLYGDYIFGDYGSGNIWALGYDGSQVTHWTRLTSGSSIVAFGTDPASGDVLFAQINDGQIRRLVQVDDPTGAPLPPTLSESGAFADLVTLTPHSGIVPYEINAPFWSDHALKTRWFSVPDLGQSFGFRPAADWSLPAGTVWVKHFDLELTRGQPETRRRLETRFLIRNQDGVYGVTYRWNDEQTEAWLVPEAGLDESFTIEEEGVTRTQVWRYPSRSECLACHTPQGGLALGFNTFQLNRDQTYGHTTLNQIVALSQMGYLSEPVESVEGLGAMVDPADLAAPLEDRLRSYLAVNCAQCHQPDGPALGSWDARFATGISASGIVDGWLVNDQGNPANRVIKPGSPAESMLLQRIRTLGQGRMPPLASTELDREGLALLELWINSLAAGPRIRIIVDADGRIDLVFGGQAGRTYRIDHAGALPDWHPLATVEPDAQGNVTFRDPQSASDASAGFYRLTEVP